MEELPLAFCTLQSPLRQPPARQSLAAIMVVGTRAAPVAGCAGDTGAVTNSRRPSPPPHGRVPCAQHLSSLVVPARHTPTWRARSDSADSSGAASSSSSSNRGHARTGAGGVRGWDCYLTSHTALVARQPPTPPQLMPTQLPLVPPALLPTPAPLPPPSPPDSHRATATRRWLDGLRRGPRARRSHLANGRARAR